MEAPRVVTSARRVRYRRSAWAVREWVLGDVRVALVSTPRALLLWAGGGAARLSGAALGVPSGLATALLGEAQTAQALARRLAAARARVALVCTGGGLDRLALPRLERALAAEMKAHPEHF